MDEVIKRDEISEITLKLRDCKYHLQRGNIFSCLVAFRDALEKMLSTRMIPSDEKELRSEINAFQQQLAASRIFREVYGPVTFRDDDLKTSLAFMKQLIDLKEEETRALLEERQSQRVGKEGEETEGYDLITQAKVLIERGNYSEAAELLTGNEEAAYLLAEEYNTSGIQLRKERRFNDAANEFRKALAIKGRDEHLYYNLARVYIDQGNWPLAATTIVEGLKINPHFAEGQTLLKYIRETGKIEE